MITIGAYLRHSTDKQEIKVQKEEAEKYIEYTFSGKEHKTFFYTDEGFSGKDMKRDDMIRLKDDIINGKINTVVAVKLDRLSRSLSDLMQLFDFFKKQEINVHIIKDKIDTSSAQGRLIFQILGAFAEFERETTTERLQSGKRYAKEHGTKSGKPMNRPRKEVNLKECIELYKKGLSMNKIAKLNNVSASVIKLRLKEKGII